LGKVEFSKWNNKIKPGDKLERIVAKSLSQRITAVRYYLRLAAKWPYEDTEYVHQLRVWSRRSVATLQLYRECLQKKHTTKLYKYLKKIRKAADNARNYDVLIKKYEINKDNEKTQQFLTFLHEKRKLSQTSIEKIFSKLEKGKELDKQIDFLKRYLKTHESSIVIAEAWSFDEWAKSHIQPFVTNFFDSTPSNTNDLNELHMFRIHGKTLRYAMELTAAVFPQNYKKELYPEIEILLAKLGAINDSAVMLRYLKNWIKSSTENELISAFEQFYVREEVNLNAELDDFQAWWSLQHIKSLHEKFDDMLCDKYRQAVV